MYHFDDALQIFLKHIQSSLVDTIQDVIILRDVYGRLSCHLLMGRDAEAIVSRTKKDLASDAALEAYCASPPVILHEPDDPLWVRMQEIARPLPPTLSADARVKIVERILEGMSWLQATRTPFEAPPPYIITFYSFKGGVGRTTAAALVALKFARQGQRVCLIDFDLEAPGLSGIALPDPSAQTLVGVIDYLLERRLATDSLLPMSDYMVRISDQDIEDKGGELWMMPAGIVDEQYLGKLGRLDFQAMLVQDFSQSALSRLFQDLQNYKPFDYYVVDARTGITDIGGLALNGLSHLNVMFFGLGEQNVRGMHFVLQHLRPLLKVQNLTPEEIASRLLIVFSPVPFGRGKREDQDLESELRQTAYDVMVTQIYEPLWPEALSFPAVEDDETPNDPVPHHPVLIRYLSDLPLQSDLQGVDYVQSQVFNPPYDQLVRRILEVKLPLLGQPPVVEAGRPPAPGPDELASIRQGLASLQTTGAAEDDLNSEDVLRARFLPLPHFRFLFDPKAFLILGRKGSGKSALFQVLRFPNYARDLANYLGLSSEEKEAVQAARWLVGFSRDTHAFLSADALSELDRRARKEDMGGFHARFWKYLAVRVVQGKLDPSDGTRLLSDDPQTFMDQLFDSAVALAVDRFLNDLEQKALYPQVGQIYLVYDHLDRMLPYGDLAARSRYMNGLIDWWQSRVPQNRWLLAKIFLREDIFDREVVVEDKSKIREGVLRYTIRWVARDNLYRLFLKWAFDTLREHLEREFPRIYRQFVPTPAGVMPPEQEDTIRTVIEWLVGEYMGAGKTKGYTYTWIPKHLSDSQGQVAPRWMIALFKEAAELAKERQLSAPIIPQKMIRQALQGPVSTIAVADLKAEYRDELKSEHDTFLPDLFKDEFRTFPQSKDSLLSFVQSSMRGVDAEKILTRLEEIGLLERRKPTKERPEEHYQIPDIILYGLGLTRRG